MKPRHTGKVVTFGKPTANDCYTLGKHEIESLNLPPP